MPPKNYTPEQSVSARTHTTYDHKNGEYIKIKKKNGRNKTVENNDLSIFQSNGAFLKRLKDKVKKKPEKYQDAYEGPIEGGEKKKREVKDRPGKRRINGQ